MLTTDQLAAIRERCEEDSAHRERLNIGSFIAHAREDIPALLDEVERLLVVVETQHDESEIKKNIHKHHTELLTEDRDCCKARCEAMERALRQYAPCHSCINIEIRRQSDFPGGVCSECVFEYKSKDHWQFDEARFAGSVNHDS